MHWSGAKSTSLTAADAQTAAVCAAAARAERPRSAGRYSGVKKSAALQWKAAGRRAEKRAAARTVSGAFAPVSSPSAAGSGSLVPARGHGGRAAGRARQGCVCGAGYPVRPFEQRNAPARSGGSDGPPARFSGPRAGSPPARLARRSAEPVNRRSNAGEPTREAARPRGQRCRSAARSALFCPPLHADVHFPGAGRERIWKHSRRNARQTPPAALSRRSAPPKGRWADQGPVSSTRAQTRPVRRENGGRRAREAAKRLPPGAARRGKRSGKPDHSEARTGFCPRRYPRKAAPTGAKRPQFCIRETPRQDAERTRSTVRNRPSRGAERRSIGG